MTIKEAIFAEEFTKKPGNTGDSDLIEYWMNSGVETRTLGTGHYNLLDRAEPIVEPVSRLLSVDANGTGRIDFRPPVEDSDIWSMPVKLDEPGKIYPIQQIREDGTTYTGVIYYTERE